MEKKYLKELFAAQAELESKVEELDKVNVHQGCDKCSQTSKDVIVAKIEGLLIGEKLIDACINNYLRFHKD